MRPSFATCLLLLALASASAAAQESKDCVSIGNDVERLRCYDAAHRRTPPAFENPRGDEASRKDAMASAPSAPKAAGTSVWEQRVLDDAAREIFTLTTHKPAYALFTRITEPNRAPYRIFDPDDRMGNREAKLQLSLKTKAANDLFGGNADLWLAYTQVAFWQIANDEISSPFRETNHEAEAYVSFLTDYKLLGFSGRSVNVGLDHQSNGQARPLSRSWNRVFAEAQLVRGGLALSIKPWIRIRENARTDDNPDIGQFLGNYEFRASWDRERHLYSVMLRNAFDREKRYNAELSWSFPLTGSLRGMVQWYSGYGENLIDYNFKHNRIGFGLLMSDWL